MKAPVSARSERRLRFLWQIDADGRFTMHSDAFLELVGHASAARTARSWRELAVELELDPEGRVERAIAARATFSAVALDWPAKDGGRLVVHLSGLPIFGAERSFRGYRGFGVCRDPLPFLERDDRGSVDLETPDLPHELDCADAQLLRVGTRNGVPFRAGTATQKLPALTPNEHSAFREIADVLAANQAGEERSRATLHASNLMPNHDLAALERVGAASANPLTHTPASRGAELTDFPAAQIARLRAILDTAADGVVEIDRAGGIASVNAAAARMFGRRNDNLAGMRLTDLLASESRHAALDYFESVAANEAMGVITGGREVTGRIQGGGSIPLLMIVGRITTDEFCAVFRDLSRWKAAEQELMQAKRRAEDASAAKSEFLAKISHEIRNPLNAIIGFSEVMMTECFGPIGSERYGQYLRDIHASGEHILSLINDLLDLSKIEAGKFDLGFTGVDLNALLQSCVSIMQPQATRQRIVIRSSLFPSLPAVVADARSVRQILLNLLSNSIKFTGPGGQVIVSTALTDRGEAVLRVRDTGVGMSEKEIETALEPFRQLATSPRFGSGGTGLGLPLTKALVEANRATFFIKSAVNAGTLVEITFPVTRVLAE
jgi:PAS domain S-box-containing protein